MNDDSIVFLNSDFVPLNEAKISVMDRGFLYGDGIFETLRAYGGKIFKLQEHLERMRHSASVLQLSVPHTQMELANIIAILLEKNDLQNAIVRITLTRGVSDHGILIGDNPPTLVLFARSVDEIALYETGVSVVLVADGISALPGMTEGIKSCNFLSNIILREFARQRGAFEAIGLDVKERLTEGSVSNVFIVKEGILKTPDLNASILPGITRQTVLEIADGLEIETMETELTPELLYDADEVFIVNTGWEIIPVVEADGRRIGSGMPGPLTRRIHEGYRKIIEALNNPC
jgi:branched-chain amino acid aminotransferase